MAGNAKRYIFRVGKHEYAKYGPRGIILPYFLGAASASTSQQPRCGPLITALSKLTSRTSSVNHRCMHAFLRTTFRQHGTQISRLAGRNASTTRGSTNPYPYPSNSNPTPHQIFHLPLSASQQEVKSRCVHHPTDRSTVLQR